MINIDKPTFLINKKKCLDNLDYMSQKAAKHSLKLRPHFKTHQSVKVGSWFGNYGVDRITVSSVSMAKEFASDGWKDILVAFPVNIREINEINQLAEKIKLSVLIESTETLNIIRHKLDHSCHFYIKIDTGYHRTGVDATDLETINEILAEAGKIPKLHFSGFLVHSGNTYQAKSVSAIQEIHEGSLQQLNVLKKMFQKDYPEMILSIGDTPSCSTQNYFEGIDEIRPGNFIYYDLMQHYLGSCQMGDIAAALVCPIVAKHPERNEIVIYGGAVHLSKESVKDPGGERHFGLVAAYTENGWDDPYPDTYLNRLSQEHGIFRSTSEILNQINIGDLVAVLPVHSCLTANLMKENTMILG